MIIGLTGQTGSGKSTASKIFEDNGFFIINADSVARAVSENEDCLYSLVNAFSEEILDEKKRLNRKKLGSIVFSDKEKLELLNKTIFPYIIKEIKKIAWDNSDKNIILDAPTLFESGLDASCEIIVSVLSRQNIRIKRITERDGISKEDALKRINSQKAEKFFKANSDYVIENNGSIHSLHQNTIDVINKIRERMVEKV